MTSTCIFAANRGELPESFDRSDTSVPLNEYEDNRILAETI